MSTLSDLTIAPPARADIPLAAPHLSGHEWTYVKACLDEGWIAGGPFIEQFEQRLADTLDTTHVVAVSSGTAALHLALLAVGVQPDDEVLLPALTFIAPANAVRYVGAWPVFLDVDTDYAQMNPRALEAFLRERCDRRAGALWNRDTGRRVTAILPVDLLGHPADLDAIAALADAFGLVVIEDASEALGARLRGRPMGARSRVAALSFNGNKLLTTGGGGALATADERIAARARYLATQAKDDPVQWVHGTIGYNYRLTNVQAAIGCAQIEQIDGVLAAKRRIAQRYARELGTRPGLRVLDEASWALSSFWMSTLRVDATRAGVDAGALHRALAAEGIETRPLWQPLHLSPAHRESRAHASCPTAEAWQREGLCLPCSSGLTPDEQTRVIDVIHRSCRA